MGSFLSGKMRDGYENRSLASRIMALLNESWARKLFSRLAPKGSLTHAAIALGSVTLVGQVIAVLLAPVYSRLYDPADYGVFSVYNSIVTIVLTVGSLCYEQGIPICSDEREAVGLTVLSTLIIVLVGLGAVAWLGLGALLGWVGSGFRLGGYLWLVPAGIVGAGTCRAINFWALRRKAMGAIARTAGWSMAGSNAINLTCGVLSPSPLGLMLGSIAGYTTGMWSLAIQSKLILQLKEIGWLGLNPRDFWGLARKYKRLALIQAPSTLFNSLGIYLPGVLAAPFCGAYFAGQLFMGMKIIALPSSLIGVALSQVFYSGAAAIARERPEDLARFFNKVFIRGTAGSVLILLVGQAARWAIPIALGEKWKMASEIAPWLSLGEAVGFSVSALSSIPNVVGRLYGQFVINATRAVAVFLLFFLNQRLGFSGMILVKCYTLVMVLNYIGCFFLYRYQVNLVSRTGKTGWKKTN